IENNDKLFHKINEKVSIENCIKIAQNRGKVCSPLNDINYCPFFAYSDNECYIGGSNNDTRLFNNGSIPVYPTPLNNIDDIKKSEIMSLNNIKNRLNKRKENLEKKIENMELYIDAINEG